MNNLLVILTKLELPEFHNEHFGIMLGTIRKEKKKRKNEFMYWCSGLFIFTQARWLRYHLLIGPASTYYIKTIENPHIYTPREGYSVCVYRERLCIRFYRMVLNNAKISGIRAPA